MAHTYGFNYAESTAAEKSPNPDGLWAGDTPSPSTIDVLLTVATTALAQFQPLQRNTTTFAYEPWASGNEIAAITAYSVPVGANQRAALYVAGCFNIDAIAWPEGTTEAQVQAAARGMLVFRKLQWSDKRSGSEPAPGTPAGP